MEIILKEMRNSRGLSVRELAKRSGISNSAIFYIESGRVSPRLDTLELIANALGCGIKDLFIE